MKMSLLVQPLIEKSLLRHILIFTFNLNNHYKVLEYQLIIMFLHDENNYTSDTIQKSLMIYVILLVELLNQLKLSPQLIMPIYYVLEVEIIFMVLLKIQI